MAHRPGAVAGVALALLAALCFGVPGPLAKALIHADLSPLQTAWIRVAGTALVLGLSAAASRRRLRVPPLRSLVAFGLLSTAGVQACYFIAASRLPVGIALLLEFTGPVLVVIWEKTMRGVRLRRTVLVGIALCLAGLASVVEIWSGIGLDPLGLAAALGASACLAAYFLIGKPLTDRSDTRTLVAGGFCVGAVALFLPAKPWSIDWEVFGTDVAFATGTLNGGVVAAAMVAATAAAYSAAVTSLRLLPTTVSAGLSYASIPFTALIAWAFLAEHLNMAQLVGGALVTAGVYAVQRAATADREPRRVAAGATIAAEIPAER